MESHYIYEICAVVSTLVFIAIGIYLIITLRTVTESLKHINVNLSKLETKLDPISNEAIRLMENSNEIAESIQERLTDLDPLMGSISNIGFALKNITSSFKDEDHSFRFFQKEKKKDWKDNLNDFIQLASLGVSAWQKIKKEK